MLREQYLKDNLQKKPDKNEFKGIHFLFYT